LCAKDREDIVEAGDSLPGFCHADTVVMGCGNVLLGDDGFGPEVIRYLRDRGLPDNVVLLDAGTGISRILFDIALAPTKPGRLVVVDAMKLDLPAGVDVEIKL
jgi:coenzyme F420 hydrogenase subunit delta